MIENSMPSRCGRPVRQYCAWRVTITFWLSAQLTNRHGPAPTGLRPKALPAAFWAVGETIMPARSEKTAGSAASGWSSMSLTCVGLTTALASMLDRSAFRFEAASPRLRSMFQRTASASHGLGVARRAVMKRDARLDAQQHGLRVRKDPFGHAGLGLECGVVPFDQRVVHRPQDGMVGAGATHRRVETRRIGRTRDPQHATLLRRGLREHGPAQAQARQTQARQAQSVAALQGARRKP